MRSMRCAFASPIREGRLVLCGPIPLLGQAAREAAGLWPARSFAHVVRAVSPPSGSPHQAVENMEWKSELMEGERYRSAWRLTIPEQLRTPEAGAALREVGRPRSLLPADPVGARGVLDESRISGSPIPQYCFRADAGGDRRSARWRDRHRGESCFCDGWFTGSSSRLPRWRCRRCDAGRRGFRCLWMRLRRRRWSR